MNADAVNPAADLDCLKLTCYFGERHRTGGGFVADQLLDVFGRGELATSIMLRGVEGFGFKQHLRTDSSLSLSEDLPAVAIAVDTAPRLSAVLDDVTAIGPIGLVTLERARLLDGEPLPPTGPDDEIRLTVYLGRKQRVGRRPAFIAVCDLLHRHGVAGASVLLGVDGTVRGHRARARFFGRNADVPVMILAVGAADRIAAALPELHRMLPRPLVTVERVRICKRGGVLLAPPIPLPDTDAQGRPLHQKIMVLTSEKATVRTSAGPAGESRPIHRALTRELRRGGAGGATTLRGMWGFHGDSPPHGDRPWQIGRGVPTLTVVIDTPSAIARTFPIIDELTAERGLVTSEMIPAARVLTGDGKRGELRPVDYRW